MARRASPLALSVRRTIQPLMDLLPDAVVLTDPGGRILDINEEAERLSGYERDELVGQPVDSLVPERLRDLHRAHREAYDRHPRRRAMGTGVRICLRRRDGSERAVDILLSPLVLGSTACVLSVVRDITGRLEATTALEEREAIFHGLFEYSPDAIVVVGDDGTIRQANLQTEGLFGYTRDELVGQPIEILMPGRYRARHGGYRQAYLTQPRTRPMGAGLELYGLRKDGSEFPVDIMLSPMRAEDGRLILAVVRDITERKQAEELLQRSHEELEQRVAERTQELHDSNASLRSQIQERERLESALRQSNRELEAALASLRQTQEQVIAQERLRAMGEMASGVAHDLNNALVPILGFTELLLQRPDYLSDTERLGRYLSLIQTAANDAAQTIRRLREFYRPRDEVPVRAPVDLNDLIEESLELTRFRWKDQAQAGGGAIDIETDLETLPPLSGDAAALREVLTNLIFNAVDALPHGGRIILRTRAVADPPEIVMEVSDTGTGMSEETRRRCLEPFYTTKGERGTGLGLSVVYGIVQRHGGEMRVDSRIGHGTSFRITFPAPAPEAPASPGPAPEEAVRPLEILVVEDDAFVRELLLDFLSGAGHRVEAAVDGDDGWARFQAGRFDLVITDQAMPGMNGIELARRIDAVRSGQPVLLMTGFADFLEVDRETPTGISRVVRKPIGLRELEDAITQVARR